MQYHLNGFVPGDPDIQPAEPARRVGANGLPTHVDVIIAGCGPAGLCLAAQLARYRNISTMIVEPKSGPMEKGQADGISVRSMEMFQTFGFAEKLSRESVWINETTFWTPNPSDPKKIARAGRVQDVQDGLSEMPHVLINQARIHDMFLDVMKNAPTRLEPDYNLKIVDLEIDSDTAEFPVTVHLERTDADRSGQHEVLRAKYVVGCDGARSRVRRAIGGKLQGDAAHQAWGVMDILVNTDFPDIRMKSIIQSQNDGSILVLPREGGYLVRLYVEMDKLSPIERVADRGLSENEIIAKAQRILHPHILDVKEVVWWSIYEIGHRLTDRFDDVPQDQITTRAPRVFIAGDACHTHSPKAGQGMNVSMGDTFNLGWKLISVLQGHSDPMLLATYSEERRATAKALIDFDHQWSRAVSTQSADGQDETPMIQRKFVEGGRFTAGLTVCYNTSAITGNNDHQSLATSLPMGERFHSAPVVRLADAKPMELGHVVEVGHRWTLFAFAPDATPCDTSSAMWLMLDHLQHDAKSPIKHCIDTAQDPDSLLDVRAIYQQGFRDIEWGSLHPVLRPAKGKYGLTDYEKVFCADGFRKPDIFDLRGINRNKGVLILVRPDQYISQILPLSQTDVLFAHLNSVWSSKKGA